jgi:hypothetical protein
MVAHESAAGTELRFAVDWINKQPALRAILAEADRAEPDLDFEGFDQALQSAGGDFTWPCRTEQGRASLVWRLMQHLAGEQPTGSSRVSAVDYAFAAVGTGGTLTDNWRAFSERVLQPLFDYLTERVGAESSVLYVLERYVRRVEWFDRQDLYDQARDAPRTEEVYDRDLRRFLFSEGINMPFSQAKSASGLSDVVSELDTDDPLVCELKIFDGAGRGKAHLGSGVNQADQYATDYGKHTAYLVIINLSGRQLTLPSDGEPEIWPPFIDVAGVRVYLIPVRALPTASASKQGRPAPVNITRVDLVDPDATDSAAD